MEIQAKAKAIGLRCSPFKLRPLANVIRGKSALYGIGWLQTCGLKRALLIKKLIDSAIANAKFADDKVNVNDLMISNLQVDQGPVYKYFKPGAQGRSNVYRKRLSHISIQLKLKAGL